MKIAAFCDKDTAVGLRLAGVGEIYVPDDNMQNIWHEISEKDDIGIIIITEKISELLEKDLREFRLRKNIPIIVEIPDKSGHQTDHIDYISYLIKKAVGVEVEK